MFQLIDCEVYAALQNRTQIGDTDEPVGIFRNLLRHPAVRGTHPMAMGERYHALRYHTGKLNATFVHGPYEAFNVRLRRRMSSRPDRLHGSFIFLLYAGRL